MILAMHQPNFLPWVGYFEKLNQSDVFILLDMVQVPRGRSYANRTRIKGKGGIVDLTIPVSKQMAKNGFMTYQNMLTVDGRSLSKIVQTFKMTYSKAPFFDEVFPTIETLVRVENICDFNVEFIEWVVNYLGISTKATRMSELFGAETEIPMKNDLILALCKWQGADTYLSGQGARIYNDESFLKAHGVALQYHEFSATQYPQFGKPFDAGLSMADCLCHLGTSSMRIL